MLTPTERGQLFDAQPAAERMSAYFAFCKMNQERLKWQAARTQNLIHNTEHTQRAEEQAHAAYLQARDDYNQVSPTRGTI